MGSAKDDEWAAQYILDPLTAPEPHQETGPGAHLQPSPEPSIKDSYISHRSSELPTPPHSASPSKTSFSPTNPYSSHRQQAFSQLNDKPPAYQQQSSENASPEQKSRRRGSSLGQRFPGDESHKPLEILRRESKRANKAPHLRKKTLPPTDQIDALDFSTGNTHYHHGGPYDAVLASRNLDAKYSPIEAVRTSNEEALKATPRENILDSLNKHVPLQGVATVPPGMRDFAGREMNYEEGTDMMRENDGDGGNYGQWPGVKYSKGDLKGKGEPSYTIEKALKEQKHQQRDSEVGYEMEPRSRQRSSSHADQKGAYVIASSNDDSSSIRRSNTTGMGEGLKKRFGSLRRKKHATDA